MRVQLIKKGENKWQIKLFLGRGQEGKRKFFTQTVYGNKRAAQQALAAKSLEFDAGGLVQLTTLTLNEFADKWLETAVIKRVRERTHADYKDVISRYIRPALGWRKIANIKPVDVQTLYTDMQGRGLSSRSIRYTHTLLNSMFKTAIKWQMLARNPCEAAELPRMEHKEMKSLSPEEAARFVAAAADDPHGLVLVFALVTGMRPEEYFALRWADLDLARATAVVKRVLVWRRGGGFIWTEPKTAKGRRTIPLPHTTVRALQEHKRRQLEERLMLGPDYRDYDLVFATSQGTPLNIRNLTQRHYRKVLDKAGLPLGLRLYDLRHSCASLLMAEGENPKVVAERLGHANVAMTLNVYSHVLPTMQRAATEKLETLLFG